MMPSLGRKLRLLTDWNVGLLFGRDTAELGQLGHPPGLGDESLIGTSSGGTPEAEA
jgi:NADH dehydrogenase